MIPATKEPPKTCLATLARDSVDTTYLPMLLGDDDEDLAPQLFERGMTRPLRDLVSRPGKQLRARLVERAWAVAVHAGGRPTEPSLPPEIPLLVELIHAGSLVVDDIEDGATERRGQPALHVTHGLPIALNAGTSLYFLPLWRLAHMGLAPDLELALHRRATAAMLRCHHGQALDLSLTVTSLPQKDVLPAVRLTTRLKTGSLFALSCELGAVVAGAPPPVEKALSDLGKRIGEALQMLDDLTSITDPKLAHKAAEDLCGAHPTWPWAWLADSLDAPSFQSLQALGASVAEGKAAPAVLADAMATMLRFAGPARVREHLERSVAEAAGVLGASPPFADLVADVRGLSKAFTRRG